MDFRRRARYALIAVLLCGGCRQNAAQHELLERELRFQEDRIYELEAELEDAKRALERAGGSGTLSPRGASGSTFCPPAGTTVIQGPTNEFPTFSTSPPTTILEGPSSIAPGGSAGSASPNVITPSAPSSTPSTVPSTVAPSAPSALPSQFDISPPKVELPNAPSTGAPSATGGAPSMPAPSSGTPILSPPDPNKPEGLPSRSLIPAAPASGAPSSGTPPAIVPRESPRDASGITPGSSAAPPFKTMSSPKFRSPSERRTNETNLGAPEQAAAPPNAAFVSTPADPDASAPATTSLQLKISERSGGWNSDGRPGDEGLRIVAEVRDARRQLVSAVGSLTIVVIDPAIAGEGGRYARWDFAADAADAAFRPAEAEGDDDGFVFELPWPDAPPAHPSLHVFVRLTTLDGRRLEADRKLVVDLGGASDALHNLTDEPGIMPAVLADPISGPASPPTPSPPPANELPLVLPEELSIPVNNAPPPAETPLTGPRLEPAATQASSPWKQRK